MSMHNLTRDGEFRYIVQWFNEWSELQRDDFVPVLVEYLTATQEPEDASSSSESGSAAYMNGVVHAVANVGLHDRPMSLFQCRIKLFREWCGKWPVDFKPKLKQKILQIDTKVGEKVINELKRNNGEGVSVNGDCIIQANGTLADNFETNVNDEVMNVTAVLRAAQSVVAATEAAINADARIVAQLRSSQTPVDGTIDVDESQSTDNGECETANSVDTNAKQSIDTVIEASYSAATIDTATEEAPAATTTATATIAQTVTAALHAEPAEPVQLPTQEHVVVASAATALVTAIQI